MAEKWSPRAKEAFNKAKELVLSFQPKIKAQRNKNISERFLTVSFNEATTESEISILVSVSRSEVENPLNLLTVALLYNKDADYKIVQDIFAKLCSHFQRVPLYSSGPDTAWHNAHTWRFIFNS